MEIRGFFRSSLRFLSRYLFMMNVVNRFSEAKSHI
jgi:hypothetical protein